MQTHITTFYSFKGGVGRSLLLANVGALLAQQAAPVLLWDLDLEAPGLHHIPALRPKPVPKAGFLEWLQGRGERLGQSPSAAELNRLWKSVKPVPGREGLFILPACGDKADFAGLYQQIAWQGPMVEQPEQGLNLFRSLLAHLAEKGGFAHLLLDARTGVTDLGGLMAAVLPHATVLVGGYGRQNRAGLLQVYRALQPAVDNRLAERGSLPPLARLLVTSPVPDLPERRDECRRSWREDFVLAPEATQFEIPFDGRLLFEERLLAIEEPTSPIGLAYQQIADALAELRDESQRTQKQASIAAETHDDPRWLGAERVVRGKRFEERVARLLTLLDYRVEPEQYLDNANKVDLIARRTAGLRQECFLVECKDWEKPVPKAELERFRSWLNGPQAQQMRAEGLYVARSYTRDALSYAKSQGLIAVTPQELEAQLFDFRPYLDRLRRRFEESPLARHYVAQRVLLESEPELKDGVDLIEHAQAWANGAGRRLWLVLGDYGTGKSSFFKRFAYELATRAIQEPDAPVPLAIDLKDYPNAISLEALLQEHLRKELNWHGNPEILLYLLAAGRVTLLLDAFDEMGTAALARSVEDQFRQLVRPTAQAGEGARCNRVLITCRTHFFRDQQQIKDVAGGHADDLVSSDSPLGQLARQLDASIDEVMLFNDAQIAEFLCRHLGEEKAREALNFIRRTYDLESLAPRPVLLDMIVQTLPELMQAGGAMTPAGLYLRYTGHWLDDNSGGNLRTSSQQRLKLLETLAQMLCGLPEHRIHYRKFEALVHELPDALRDGIDPQRIDLELRTAAFLTRTADGFYGFSHKSFREFFFARALLRALRSDVDKAAAVLDTARLTPEMVAFLADLMEAADEESLATLTTHVLSAPYRRDVSENAVLLASEWMRYRRPFDVDHPEVWFNGMRALIPEAANLQGAEFRDACLSLLCLQKADLTDACLDGAELMHADLAGALLRNARLSNVDLSAAHLSGADLSGAEGSHSNLSHAEAQGACFRGVSLPFCNASNGQFIEADFSGSDLTAAVFVDADCSRGSFRNTNCHAARFAFANLHNVDWYGADLVMATGPEAIAEAPLPFVEPVAQLVSYVTGGNSGSVGSVAISPDGHLLLTGGEDGSTRLWDAASGIELRRFDGSGGPVNSVAFAPSAKQVLTGGDDGSARLWDITTGRELRRFDGHGGPVNSVAFAPSGGQVLTSGYDGSTRLWDTVNGHELRRFEGHENSVSSVAFSPSGGQVLTGGQDGSARLWDITTGRELCRFAGHGGAVNSVAFSPSGGQVLTGRQNGSARLWDTASGRKLRSFDGHGGPVMSVAFSPSGRQVLTGGADGSARLWEAATGHELRRFDGYGGPVNSVAFAPSGRQVLTGGSDGSVRLCDAASGRELRRFEGHGGPVMSVAFSPSGGQMLTGGADGNARLWDTANGRELSRFEGHDGSVWSVAFASSGGQVLTGGRDGSARLWEAASGRELHRFEGHGDWVRSVAFSPSGRQVLTGGQDGSARLWDTASGRELCRFKEHGGPVDSVAFSPSGGQVLTGGVDGSARLWEVATGCELRRFEGQGGPVRLVAFAPSGEQVLTGGADGRVRLWETASGRELHRFEGHGGPVRLVALSPSGEQVLTGGLDGRVRLWEVVSGRELRRFDGHGGWVWSVAFAPSGGQVLTGGDDGSARLWDVETGTCRLRLYGFEGNGFDEPGWLSLDARDRYRGNAAGIARLSYVDPDDLSLMPTHWLAEDLPHLQAPDPEAPGGD